MVVFLCQRLSSLLVLLALGIGHLINAIRCVALLFLMVLPAFGIVHLMVVILCQR